MPNTGKPSKDCHTCRKRRVKCTLERPECERCLRIGKSCPGYRDEQSLMFKNEDLSSLGGPSAVRDRRIPRPDDSPDVEVPESAAPQLYTPPWVDSLCDWSFQGIRLRDLDPIILRTNYSSPPFTIPLSDWGHFAVPVVLAMVSYEFEGQRLFTQFQGLVDLLSTSSEESPLMMCCQALGIAYLSNRFWSIEAETTRDQAYVRALAATNILVGDPELCLLDESCISVWLLSLYEVVAGSQGSMHGSSAITWSIHAQGQVELLRLRGPGQLRTPTGRGIFWLMVMSTQTKTMITGEEYPAFISKWLTGLRSQITGSGLAFVDLNNFACDLSAIATRAREALTTDHTEFLSWTIMDLWDRALTLQEALAQGVHDHPRGEPVNLENVYISNLYRTYYTRTLQHLLDLAESPQARGDITLGSGQLDVIISSIREIVQGLASATLSAVTAVLIPVVTDQGTVFRIGDSSVYGRPICWTDILKLFWSLRILSARKQLLEPMQIRMSEALLHCIGEEFGIRQAVATYHLLDGVPSE